MIAGIARKPNSSTVGRSLSKSVSSTFNVFSDPGSREGDNALANVLALYMFVVLLVLPTLAIVATLVYSVLVKLLCTVAGYNWNFGHLFFTVAAEITASHVGLASPAGLPDGHFPRLVILILSVLAVVVFSVVMSTVAGPVLSFFIEQCGKEHGRPQHEQAVLSRGNSMFFAFFLAPSVIVVTAATLGLLMGWVAADLSTLDGMWLVVAQLSSMNSLLTFESAAPIHEAWAQVVFVFIAMWGLSLRAVVTVLFGGPTLKLVNHVREDLSARNRAATKHHVRKLAYCLVILPCICVACASLFGVFLATVEDFWLLPSFMSMLRAMCSTGSGFRPAETFGHGVSRILMLLAACIRLPWLPECPLYQVALAIRWCVFAETTVILGRSLSPKFVDRVQRVVAKGKPLRTQRRRFALAVWFGWPVLAALLSCASGMLLAVSQGWSMSEGIYAQLTELFGTQMQLAGVEVVSSLPSKGVAAFLVVAGAFVGSLLRASAIGAVVAHTILPNMLEAQLLADEEREYPEPLDFTTSDLEGNGDCSKSPPRSRTDGSEGQTVDSDEEDVDEDVDDVDQGMLVSQTPAFMSMPDLAAVTEGARLDAVKSVVEQLNNTTVTTASEAAGDEKVDASGESCPGEEVEEPHEPGSTKASGDEKAEASEEATHGKEVEEPHEPASAKVAPKGATESNKAHCRGLETLHEDFFQAGDDASLDSELVNSWFWEHTVSMDKRPGGHHTQWVEPA